MITVGFGVGILHLYFWSFRWRSFGDGLPSTSSKLFLLGSTIPLTRLAISRSTPLWRSSLRIEIGLPDLGFVIDYAFNLLFYCSTATTVMIGSCNSRNGVLVVLTVLYWPSHLLSYLALVRD